MKCYDDDEWYACIWIFKIWDVTQVHRCPPPSTVVPGAISGRCAAALARDSCHSPLDWLPRPCSIAISPVLHLHALSFSPPTSCSTNCRASYWGEILVPKLKLCNANMWPRLLIASYNWRRLWRIARTSFSFKKIINTSSEESDDDNEVMVAVTLLSHDHEEN
jgi:hypothetical protein